MVLLGLALALDPSAPRAQSDIGPPPWRVLLLYGTDFYAPTTVAIVDALRTAIQEGAAPRTVDFRAEALDIVSLDPTGFEPELVSLLEKKYHVARFDLIVPLGIEPLRFVVRHPALWTGVPIVSVGLGEADLPEVARVPNATGLAVYFDAAGTLALARHLQPDAVRVVLVAGDAEYDRGWWPLLEAAAADQGRGLEVERLFGLPVREVVERVSQLPPRSIVLFGSVSRETDGQPTKSAIVTARLAHLSTAPIYCLYESFLGTGVIGGSMESFEAAGRRGAAVALRTLRGDPGDAALVPPPRLVPILDWPQLRRFGLSGVSLPPGAIVRNRPPSLMEEYGGYVIGAVVALSIQTGLIVALLAQARRRRQAEAEASRQRAELAHSARLSAVGQLTAVVAHEINQPLGAILSNAEAAELFLEADPPRLDRVRQILRDIQQEDQRASAVIREVRALARKPSEGSKSVDLNEVVRGVMPLLEADARRRGVDIELDLARPLPVLSADSTQFQQVVLNLGLNGLEAMGPPGPGERRLRIQTRIAGEQLELTVSDTGPGLAQDVIPRLFESFFTTKANGLGLGLSIVSSIVAAHGGRVAAENNTTSHGATFRVLLPPGKQVVESSESLA